MDEFLSLKLVKTSQLLDIEFLDQPKITHRFYVKKKKSIDNFLFLGLESFEGLPLCLWVDKTKDTLEMFGILSLSIP